MALQLTFIEATRPVGKPRTAPEVRRRDKLVAAIHQQIQLIEADMGEKERPKSAKGRAIRSWYWPHEKGFAAEVKFGPRILGLDARGKQTTFGAASLKQLVTLYRQISDEVVAGGLDKQIAALAGTMGRAAKK